MIGGGHAQRGGREVRADGGQGRVEAFGGPAEQVEHALGGQPAVAGQKCQQDDVVPRPGRVDGAGRRFAR